METVFTARMIRELRGSPLTVLLACVLLDQAGNHPITAQAIKDVTGYGDNTVTDCIRVLSDPVRQYLTRARGGWRLAGAILQLPLSTAPDGNREKYDFPPSSSCSSSNRKEEEFIAGEEEERIAKSEEIAKSTILETCLDLGIREPKASLLASLPHVTPQFVTDHVKAALAHGHTLGTAIYRIQHNWKAILDEKKPDPPDGRNYITGEYAEYIQH